MRLLLGRLGAAAVTVFIACSLMFFAIRTLPGDPVLMLLGEQAAASPDAVEAMRARLGMDRSLIAQYAGWIAGVFQLDLGESLMTGRPVVAELAARIPRSLELMLGGIVVSILVGLPLGVVAARWSRSFAGTAASVFGLIGLSTPSFVKGIFLIIIFSLWVKILPSSGHVAFSTDPWANLQYLVMPALVLGIGFGGVILRVTRASLLETLGKDFVRTIRAKGLSERGAIYRHALPNALIPVVSIVGIRIGGMLGGTVIVESLFNWPGLSSYLIEACYNRNYPAIQGSLLAIFTMFALMSFAIDLVLGLLDPRIRNA